MKTVNLDNYNNDWYKPGNKVKRIIWYLINMLFFKSSMPYCHRLKILLLRVFGAKAGRNVIIKPNVSIKYPWFLEIGDNVWIGEGVCIDNLAKVRIGNNVCISQLACILTGNHNYKKTTFDLIVSPVNIEDGVWVGARALVCPGVTLKSHSVVTAGSVISKDTESFTIYRGVPAGPIRKRIIE